MYSGYRQVLAILCLLFLGLLVVVTNAASTVNLTFFFLASFITATWITYRIKYGDPKVLLWMAQYGLILIWLLARGIGLKVGSLVERLKNSDGELPRKRTDGQQSNNVARENPAWRVAQYGEKPEDPDDSNDQADQK